MSDEVRRNVERLHDELTEAADAGDEHARQMLTHIGDYLDRDDPSDEEHEALRHRLDEALVRFDTEHPTLSGAIKGVVDSLGAAGI